MTLVYSADNLFVDSESDTSYLFFRLIEVRSADWRNEMADLDHPVHVLKAGVDNHEQSMFVVSHNCRLNEHNPFIFTLVSFPPYDVMDDDAIWLTINSWCFYEDPLTQRRLIAAVGYRADSAFIARLDPVSDEYGVQFLAAGEDGTGDGKWLPNLSISGLFDYDYDGKSEAFIYLNSIREKNTRILFCVEMATLDIEWSVPVSSTIDSDRGVFESGDSLDPCVMFASKNPFQGFKDENFNDRFGYISKVDRHGQLVYHRLASVGIGGIRMTPADVRGEFYVMHDVPLTDPRLFADLSDSAIAERLADSNYYISKIGQHGDILQTTSTPDLPRNLWLQPYGPDHESALFVKFTNGAIRVYDSTLVPLTQSNTVRTDALLGITRIDGYGRVYVYNDGIYSSGSEKLVNFPFNATLFEAVTYDVQKNAITVVICSTNRYFIGDIVEKSLGEKITILYDKHRSLILMLLAGLIVALSLVSYYSRRTKRYLAQIEKQRDELEETHKALIEAQATIVAHEKYRQAKDIAGGFAHEIRNALSPARNALSKLLKYERDDRADEKSVHDISRFTDEAIGRAIALTQLISQYSKLDASHDPEPVSITDTIDAVVDNLRYRLEALGVEISIEPPTIRVLSNRIQLETVFTNLFVNALDALTNTDNPAIMVTVVSEDDEVVISIADNGCGISADNPDRVFDVFYSTKPDSGTGLGLSIAKRIIELYDGSIAVSSDPRKGTVFVLKLKPYLEN